MFDKLISYLERKRWRYLANSEHYTVTLNLAGTNGVFYCFARDEQDLKRFSFLTWSIAACPADIRIGMAELLMRLNGTIFYGGFELDFESGSITFKTSIFYEGLELNDTALDNVIINNIHIMDECTPPILKFIYGGITPLEGVNIRKQQLQISDIPKSEEA
jgi:hypothetical protein